MANTLPSTHAGVDEFETYRPLLFAIAYRMLASASEAEDIVQEAYLRYHAAAPEMVRSPKAFLSTIVTRLCLDQLKSARTTREQYVGPWLPEPVLTPDGRLGPLETVEQRESISLAFLVLLEALTPPERAVFLLREVFEYGYDEIAEIVGASVAACRQLFHRAKERLAERRPRFQPSPERQRHLVEGFLAACGAGDLAALEGMLAEDVTVWSDGGGKVAAARRPVVGRAAVMRFLLGLVRTAPAGSRATIAEIGGAVGLLLWKGEALMSVMTIELAADRIVGLRTVLNPNKLAYLRRQVADPEAPIASPTG